MIQLNGNTFYMHTVCTLAEGSYGWLVYTKAATEVQLDLWSKFIMLKFVNFFIFCVLTSLCCVIFSS